MKKSLILAATLCLCLLLPGYCSVSSSKVNLHLRCLYPSVKVSLKDTHGSGVIILSKPTGYPDMFYNMVITCAHVMHEKQECNITVCDYENLSTLKSTKDYLGRVFHIDYESDIAILLFVSDKQLCVSSMDFNTNLLIGDEVRAFGFGDGQNVARMDRGEITAANLALKDHKYLSYRSSLFTVPGDSGSGVFKSNGRNELVGIRFAIIRGSTNYYNDALIVPVKVLLDVNKELDDSLGFIWNKKGSDIGIHLEFLMLTLPKMSKVEHPVYAPPPDGDPVTNDRDTDIVPPPEDEFPNCLPPAPT